MTLFRKAEQDLLEGKGTFCKEAYEGLISGPARNPKMKLAFLFPGQGSHYVGMGEELANTYPEAKAVFDEADTALGFKVSELCFSSSESDLTYTANTQPAVLTASIAAYRVLDTHGITPQVAAGHSLGEYSALVAAGALLLADAVRLVRLRGEYMQQAVPVGEGAMAAIIGLEPKVVEELCRDGSATGGVAEPANYNSPGQTVVSGTAAAVECVAARAVEAGAHKAVMLPVSAPFHCTLMKPAAARLGPHLEATPFRDLRYPVCTNVDAELVSSGDAARRSLLRQITAPVRWEEAMRRILALSVEAFIEVGPGRVLSGLLRRIDKGAAVANVEDEKSLAKTLRLTGG